MFAEREGKEVAKGKEHKLSQALSCENRENLQSVFVTSAGKGINLLFYIINFRFSILFGHLKRRTKIQVCHIKAFVTGGRRFATACIIIFCINSALFFILD